MLPKEAVTVSYSLILAVIETYAVYSWIVQVKRIRIEQYCTENCSIHRFIYLLDIIKPTLNLFSTTSQRAIHEVEPVVL